MPKDYLNLTDAEFDIFFKRLNQYLGVKCGGANPEWPHIPAAARTGLVTEYAAWYTAWANCLVPHSKVETEIKNAARKQAKSAIRPFVNQYLRYEPAQDSDRLYLGIPVKDTSPSSVPNPQNQCEADLAFPGVHLVELQKIRPVGEVSPDARADWGARIYFALSGSPSDKYPFRISVPPTSGTGMPYSVFTKRRKMRFDFDGESGCTVWFCLRYENSKGGAGPFGPVMSAVVP